MRSSKGPERRLRQRWSIGGVQVQSWAESPLMPQGQGCGPLYQQFAVLSNCWNNRDSPIISPLEELTRELITLGNHLRSRRIELELYQKDVAAKLGVTASTIWNWEHGWPIRRHFIPRIIQFLGHNPCLTTTEELKWLHYPGHTNSGKMPDYGGVSNEFKLFVPI